MFPGQLLVEARNEDSKDTGYLSLDWQRKGKSVAIGQTATRIPTEQVDNGEWLKARRDGASSDNRSLDELQGCMEQLTVERDQLHSQLDELLEEQQIVEKKQTVDSLLMETTLPPEAITETFRRQLLEADSEEDQRSLIADREAVVKQMSQHPPTSRERHDGLHGESDDAGIVAVIRRHRFSVLGGTM